MTKFEQDFCFLCAHGIEPPAAASAAELDEFLRNQSLAKSAATAAVLLEREDIRAAIEAEREDGVCTEDAGKLQAEMDRMIADAMEATGTVTPKKDADIEVESVKITSMAAGAAGERPETA